MRIVLGISGASGAIFGLATLRALHQLEVETHLIVTAWAKKTLEQECGVSMKDITSLAAVVHASGDLSASIASGSFKTAGMIVAPCSMKTLAALAMGLTGDLLTRAADVTMREGRPLVLAPRETPLTPIHLENMLKLARIHGVTVMPPVPAFYNRPETIDDLVAHFVGRVLDRFGLEHRLYRPWQGLYGPEEE